MKETENMYNIDNIKRKFKTIGAKASLVEIPEPDCWMPPIPDSDIRVIQNRRGQNDFKIEILSNVFDHARFNISSMDKQSRMLVLEVRFHKERSAFLCGEEKGRAFALRLPEHTGSGIKKALEAATRGEESRNIRVKEEVEKKPDIPKRAKTKTRGRKVEIPTLEEAHKSLNLSKIEYQFYARILQKCRRLRLPCDQRLVFIQYQDRKENHFSFALMRVAKYSHLRVRELDDWRPRSHNAFKQFSSLARHLFAKYPIPEFMDSVWFSESDSRINWFIDIGSGMNIRKVSGFPIPFTKKMAHQMMSAPANFTVEQAIRWGQIITLGGNERFFSEIERTHVTPIDSTHKEASERHIFWQTVIEWFLRHPMLDPTHYGPVVDYIEHQKFLHPRANPEFEMVGRSPQAVLRLVEEWHGALGRAPRKQSHVWTGHGMDWVWEQTLRDKVIALWEMRELLDSQSLFDEGRAMRHCVYSYSGSCKSGRSLIFSLRRDGKRVLTVEYLPHTKSLGEVRGPCNRAPTASEVSMLSRWGKSAKR